MTTTHQSPAHPRCAGTLLHLAGDLHFLTLLLNLADHLDLAITTRRTPRALQPNRTLQTRRPTNPILTITHISNRRSANNPHPTAHARALRSYKFFNNRTRPSRSVSPSRTNCSRRPRSAYLSRRPGRTRHTSRTSR